MALVDRLGASTKALTAIRGPSPRTQPLPGETENQGTHPPVAASTDASAQALLVQVYA